MRTFLALVVCLALSWTAFAQAPTKAKTAEKTAPKKEEPPKIEGMEVSRGQKGFLGVAVVNGTFKISFYDVKRKPIAADVARAVLRWDPKYKVGEERVVLTPGTDGKSLTSPRNIRPPYNFKLIMTFFKDESAGDATGETIVIDFRQ